MTSYDNDALAPIIHDMIYSLNQIADILEGRQSKTGDKETKEQKVSEPKETTVTLEDVRQVMAEKSRQGYTKEIRSLLVSHHAKKLSEVDPSEYASLLKEAQAVGDSGGKNNA